MYVKNGCEDGMKGLGYCVCLQKTAMALKEMRSNEEPATGMGTLYIGF